MIIFDIEANGLTPAQVTKIYCICTYDTILHKSATYIGSSIPKFFEINKDEAIAGHNIINYDIPVLRKFFPTFSPKVVYDTLIMSQMFDPDRPRHSLESYGEEFGVPKVQHTDWEVLSPEMLHRCEVDVEINTKVWDKLQKEYKSHPAWTRSLHLEQECVKIIRHQTTKGWLFDSNKAKSLDSRLQDRIQEIDHLLEPVLFSRVIPGSFIDKPFKKDGTLTERAKKYANGCDVGGPFTVLINEPINLSSTVQVRELLYKHGWKPTQWNYKKDKRGKILYDDNGEPITTTPKLTLDSYDTMEGDIGKLISERFKCKHRLQQIQSLLELVRRDGRIECQAVVCGTNTARMRHKGVVNIPKSSDSVFLGKEMRSLFKCSEGRVLVGCDASALEARCLAHYLDDYLFTQEILQTDIHSVWQKLAGFEEGPTGRIKAKTLNYALMYGAGDKKLGKIIGGTQSQGSRLREQLYLKCPTLAALIESVKQQSKQGFVYGIDGRKLYTRSQHSALNTLLQGCGAIIMKVAMVLINRAILKQRLDAFQVGTFHDEFTFDCSEKDAEEVAKLAKWSIIQSGKELNLKCPLDAEAKIGKTWNDIH